MAKTFEDFLKDHPNLIDTDDRELIYNVAKSELDAKDQKITELSQKVIELEKENEYLKKCDERQSHVFDNVLHNIALNYKSIALGDMTPFEFLQKYPDDGWGLVGCEARSDMPSFYIERLKQKLADKDKQIEEYEKALEYYSMGSDDEMAFRTLEQYSNKRK